MPTRYYGTARDPRRWAACRAQVRAQMLAAGWVERSLKFDSVLLTKASKLYART